MKSLIPSQQIDTLITIAMVVNNDQDIVERTLKDISNVISHLSKYHEILVVDNGSTDKSVEIIERTQKKIPNIRLLILSRRYDNEIAMAAALDNCVGDYVILFDPYYDPPSFIPRLIEKAMSGYDIVIAERKDRKDEGFFRRSFAQIFYKISGSILGFNLSPNASYFRVFSRRAINSITQIKNKSRYLKYLNAIVGFKQASIKYERVKSKKLKKTEFSYLNSFIFASEVIISHSILPLRIASMLGVIASFLNFTFLLYIFTVTLVKKKIAEGWISTSVVNATMFLLLFLILTVISEYIARILNESKDQPLYFIAEEHNSNFILEPMKKKLNVV